MQWFFALTEDSTAFREYAEMLQVAVYTARKHTSLLPHLIYDGRENDFTAWLRRHDVQIIPHRSWFRAALGDLGRAKGNPHFEAALAGAFSRVELPEIVARRGGAERVLYTDCDVIFLAEVVPELEANPCACFAVAPESVRDDYVNMNTGVMLMNIPRLREGLPEFLEYISKNLAELEKESWDEAAYRWYYRDANGPLWDKLRPELNWKPYWGDNPEAKIIHLHGPKPYQRDNIDSTRLGPSTPYTGDAYHATSTLRKGSGAAPQNLAAVRIRFEPEPIGAGRQSAEVHKHPPRRPRRRPKQRPLAELLRWYSHLSPAA